ncbi:MAG TPA: carboxypeptidase M32, partial [Bacillales bacterium]|nr:carboxypeptidase M32 [Bacillales bacterium]
MVQQLLNENVMKIIDQFKELDEKVSHYTDILSLVNWDARTGAPQKGRSIFAKAKGTLSTEMFQLSVSDEMGEYLKTLSDPEVYGQLDEVTRSSVRVRQHAYDKSKNIPSKVHNEYVVLASNANDAWEEARANNNFDHFRPYLEKMVDLKKRFAEYYGYESHPYNALLDDFEPGFTIDRLDPLFADLRQNSLSLLQRIQNAKSQPRKDMFEQEFDIETQKKFAHFIIPKLGYDLKAGRLDETTHPFATGLNTGDVRITNRYDLNNVRMAIFGTIH